MKLRTELSHALIRIMIRDMSRGVLIRTSRTLVPKWRISERVK